MTQLFPLRSCPECGAACRLIDDRLYRLDINGALHGCTAPDPDVPAALGVAMVFDDTTGLLTEADA